MYNFECLIATRGAVRPGDHRARLLDQIIRNQHEAGNVIGVSAIRDTAELLR